MTRKSLFVLCLFLLVGSFLPSQMITLKDALGYDFTVSEAPQNIVSLAPNITEVLFALGLENKVVGVTRFCDYPDEAKEKEKIGGLVNPNLERINALHPDLVIGFRGNPINILERMKSLGLRLFVLEMGEDLESVYLIIKKIGIVTRRQGQAEFLIQSMKTKYDFIQTALQDVPHQPKVFFSLHGRGLWTCGKGSFLDDLVRKAKGINIAGRINRKWLHLNREHLIHENPEMIIIISKSTTDFEDARKWMIEERHFQGLEAVQENRIYSLDENIATRPGPRLIDALDQLARLLHPQRFKKKP